MESNIKEIHESFAQQSKTFDTTPMNVSRREHMAHMIEMLSPLNRDSILEVAAGTCACGRALAETAAAVTCLDTTPEMLEVGKQGAFKKDLSNMVFVVGDAGALPFLEGSFDMALCRLAFHHIPEYEKPFSEMVRVLRPGGRLVLVDLAAPEESLCQVKDELETIRDPSHAKTLSKEEMLALFEKEDLSVTCYDQKDLPVSLDDWLDVTKVSPGIAEEITQKFCDEMAGGAKTGFDPYEEDGKIFFDQHWVTIVGTKPE